MAKAGSSEERAGVVDPRELSLEEVLKSYEQPINEEQAWAVCYQCCRGLLGTDPRAAAARIRGTADILLHKDGSVTVPAEPEAEGEGEGAAGECPRPAGRVQRARGRGDAPASKGAPCCGGRGSGIGAHLCPAGGRSQRRFYDPRFMAPASAGSGRDTAPGSQGRGHGQLGFLEVGVGGAQDR